MHLLRIPSLSVAHRGVKQSLTHRAVPVAPSNQSLPAAPPLDTHPIGVRDPAGYRPPPPPRLPGWIEIGRPEVGELGQEVIVRLKAVGADLPVGQPGEAGAEDIVGKGTAVGVGGSLDVS